MPENPKHTGPCPIRVVVRDVANPDTPIHDKTGDHNDKFFREWIGATVWWAMRNGKSVYTYPVE
jgi:hypothetical protein